MSSNASLPLSECRTVDRASLNCPEYTEGEQIGVFLRQLQQTLQSRLPVTVNVCEVRRISTLGMQVLAAAKISANRDGLKFEFVSPSPEFRRVCSDTGLSALFGIED